MTCQPTGWVPAKQFKDDRYTRLYTPWAADHAPDYTLAGLYAGKDHIYSGPFKDHAPDCYNIYSIVIIMLTKIMYMYANDHCICKPSTD